MKTAPLEKAIQKLLVIRKHIEMHESDPLLVEDFEESIFELKIKYGQYLNDVLFDIYDEYCEDDPCPDIEDFLKSTEVLVHPEDFPGGNAHLEFKTAPLRIEMISDSQAQKEVVWSAA